MYDYVFLTNIPAFYKINLYNKIAEKLRICVVYLADSSQIRNDDFYKGRQIFDSIILHNGIFERRNRISNIIKLLKYLKGIEFKRIVYGGWDSIEYWICLIMHRKNKNAMILESSIGESQTNGLRGLLKKVYLSRISAVFPSGIMHLDLLKALKYKGRSYVTKGVGIFNRNNADHKSSKRFKTKYLYVGRLSSEKNILFLIDSLRDLNESELTIVGDGPLLQELEKAGSKNVVFKGYIENRRLADIYSEHDVLVLPSTVEPWGLVVDEALYNGLPVLVSSRVGCSKDLVDIDRTGYIFDHNNRDDFLKCLNKISDVDNYKRLHKNVLKIDFSERDRLQVEAYLKCIRDDL